MSTKAEQLEWRRSKVTELRARGMTHNEIARELQVSRTSITSDIQYLRSQAKESIKEYATEHLPEQYQVCLVALDSIIKRAFDIIETSLFGKSCTIQYSFSSLFSSYFIRIRDILDKYHPMRLFSSMLPKTV